MQRPASAPAGGRRAAAAAESEVDLIMPVRRRRRRTKPPIDRGTELMRRRTKKSPNTLIWAVSRGMLERDPAAAAVEETVSAYELGLRPRAVRAPLCRSAALSARRLTLLCG